MTITTDPLAEYKALVEFGEPGSVAAYVTRLVEREHSLTGALRDILDCLKARADVSGASAYKGMGVNILQEKAAKLPAAIRWAEQVLASKQ